MKHWIFASLVFSSAPAFAAPATATGTTPKADIAALEKVVDTFRVAIIKKDKPAFMGLLYSPTIPWIGVATDSSVKMANERRKAKSLPGIRKVSGTGSATEFIDHIVESEQAIEETVDNVRIDSNGDVAQIWFDYSYVRDGYKQNWGQEAWHMVRTDEGWKINSVIWSMEFNPVLPPPRPK
ncbi:nuclear transport factor 2 family protein [Massilia sp. CCM 8733]|uniref:Nuclear transport factor 2 family protein n=1 Tax=Massilia mucilaginosa TaxID=2609282 RepID=A0ABX0P137_9BURK|nr:nuclear transport factor 2 family protein [Massilia mucilaginosa]NHZ93009.1 nuclear transport factor 2 family protein [Massilia mucilaginosa]